jgi:hypothetical protein
MSKLGIYFVEGGFSTSREGRYHGCCSDRHLLTSMQVDGAERVNKKQCHGTLGGAGSLDLNVNGRRNTL